VERTLVWHGIDASRIEIAYAEVENATLRARGTQIGVESEPYELRYDLEHARLHVEIVGGRSLDVELEDAEFFDLGYSPLFNSLPIFRYQLHRGGEPREFVMRWVSVPDLEVQRSEQRYEPVMPEIVRFRAGSFSEEIEFDEDGFVTRYPGLAERLYPGR
jgi:hypothetical protein